MNNLYNQLCFIRVIRNLFPTFYDKEIQSHVRPYTWQHTAWQQALTSSISCETIVVKLGNKVKLKLSYVMFMTKHMLVNFI